MRFSSLDIAPMGVDDIDAVAEIEKLSHPTPWPDEVFLGELTRDWAFVDVVRAPSDSSAATRRGRVIAFCNYWLVHDEVHVLNLATHPDWRRRGVATAVLDHLVRFAREHTCRCLTLEVRASNQPAQALYQGHGFVTMGVRPRYYQDTGEDALVMTLDLTASRS